MKSFGNFLTSLGSWVAIVFLRTIEWGTDKATWLFPLILLFLFLIWGIIFQSTDLMIAQGQRLLISGPRGLTLNASYPGRIKFDDTEPATMDLSLSCPIPCDEHPVNVTIHTRASLLVRDLNSNPSIWDDQLTLQLTPNLGAAKLSLLRVNKNDLSTTLDLNVGGEPVTLSAIYLEGKTEASVRTFMTVAWNNASLAITIFLAAWGWVLNDAKKNHKNIERKEHQEALRKAGNAADKLKDLVKTSGGLSEWLKDYRQELSIWTGESEKQLIKRPLEELVNRDPATVLALLSKDFDKDYETGQQAFEELKDALRPGPKSR